MDVKRIENSFEKSEKLSAFHILILACLFVTAIPQGAINFSPVFVFNTPAHRCTIPEIDEADSEPINATEKTEILEYYIPYDYIDGQPVLSKCEKYSRSESADNETSVNSSLLLPTEFCDHGWHFSGEKKTAVTEFNIVCGGDWKRPVFTQGFSVGALISGIAVGTINDRFGRRLITLASLVAQMIAIFVYSLAPTYEVVVLGFALYGLGGSATYCSVFVHAQELVKTAHRDVVACCINLCMSLGYMMMPLIAYFVDDWRWIVRIPAVLCIPLMSYFLFLPESPHWLVTKGKTREAVEVLKRLLPRKEASELALINDSKHQDMAENGSDDKLPKTKAESFSKSFPMIFRNRILLQRTLIICWMWVVSFICYYTFGYGTSNLAGDIYLTSFLSAAAEVPGWILALILLKKVGRRISLAASFAFCSLFCILCALFSSYDVASVAFGTTGKVFSTATMGMVYLYTAELYPTVLRSTGVGIASATARLLCLAAPLLAFAGEGGNTRITFYCMSAISLLAAVLALTLPETRYSTLPDTIRDALALERFRLKLYCGKRKERIRSTSSASEMKEGESGQSSKPILA